MTLVQYSSLEVVADSVSNISTTITGYTNTNVMVSIIFISFHSSIPTFSRRLLMVL